MVNQRLVGVFSVALPEHAGELAVAPTNLLAQIWFQFAVAVQHQKEYRKCGECGRWFELPSRGSRHEKTFCSQACKQKEYRSRQRHARMLFLMGTPIKEIAESTGSDAATVDSWFERSPFTEAERRLAAVLKKAKTRK